MAGASNTLVARIALEGGEAVRKQLADIGSAGEQNLLRLRGTIEGVSGSMSSLEGSGARSAAAFSQLRVAGADLHQSLNNVGTSALLVGRNLLGVVAAVGAAAAGLVALVNKADSAGAAIARGAQNIGVSVREYQALQLIASDAGLEMSVLERAFGRMSVSAQGARKTQFEFNKAIQEAGTDSNKLARLYKDQADAVKLSTDPYVRLGVAVADSSGHMRDNVEVMNETASKLLDLGNATDAQSIGMELFGKRGMALKSALQDLTANGMARAAAEAERLGGITKAQAAEALAGEQAWKHLGMAISGVFTQGGLLFSTGQKTIVTVITEMIVAARPQILAYVALLRDALMPVLADLFAVIRGHGELVATPWLKGLIDGVTGFGALVREVFFGIVVPAFNAILQVATNVADFINILFGTKITGGALLLGTTLAWLLGLFTLLGAVAGVIAPLVATIVALGVAIGFLPAALVIVGVVFAAWMLATTNVVKNVSDAFTGLWKSITDGAANAVKYLMSIVDAAKSVLNAVASAIGIGGGGGGDVVPGAAGGGHVRGRGTGTSDSILARLSHGEFVISANAVAHYGASFFAALNAMRIAPGRFSLGGLVESLRMPMPGLPRFAAGGLVTAPATFGGRPFTLVLDGTHFDMTRPNSVDELEKFAINRRIRSAGRKPGWIG